MKRPLILILLCLLFAPISFAQHRGQAHRHATTATNSVIGEERKFQQQNIEEFLHSKCTQVIRELNLSSFDSAHFEPVYHEMQKEKMDLFRKYGGMRKIRMAVEAGQTVPDTTLMRVVTNNAKLQVEDALLEQRYMNKLARILTPLQLFKLQQAEQKFRSEMIRRGKAAKK